MLRIIAVVFLLLPLTASAQHIGHSNADHATHMLGTVQAAQPGQGAFAAIQEIVEILEKDLNTDWSRVNIDALREHLVDMSNVTLSALVRSETLDNGMRFTVTGQGAVQASIRRMLVAHAGAMDGVGGWHFTVAESEGGAILTVEVPAKDMNKLRGLGFMGTLIRGMHHQEHHLMIARGENPHHH